MFGVNGWEIVLLALIAVFVLGPDRMPEYAAKLAHGIRKLRVMAEGAKDQLKDQLGPEYEEINWRQYDPRQYDPRRIVKEALLDPLDDAIAPIRGEIDSVRDAASRRNGEAVAGGAAAAGALTAGDSNTATSDGSTTDDSTTDDSVVDNGPTGIYGAADAPVLFDARSWDPARPVPWDPDAT